MNWYLRKAGSETVYGPVDEKNLEAWAADGRVAPNDLVSADRREWKPAPTVSSLKMEWVAQLPDGKPFGPVPSQALRELIRSGELKPDTPVRSAKSGLTMTLSALLESEEKPSAAELKWKAEAEAARKASAEAEARAGQAGAALQAAQDQRARAEQERDGALRRAEEAGKKALDLEKKADEAEARARSAAEQLASVQAKAASAAEQSAREAAEARAAAQKQTAELQARSAQLASARAEIATWREQCERARVAATEAAVQAEKARQEAAKPSADLVPRDLLEEARRRIAQLERGYKQALQTVQRSLSARVGENQSMPPEQLRRGDIA